MRNIFIFLICIGFSLSAVAQNNKKAPLQNNKVCEAPVLIDIYVDSLRFYKQQLDSLRAVDNIFQKMKALPDGRYARLFSPLNFYPDLAHRHFSLDRDETLTTDDQALIDNTLLNFYLYHPQYVSAIASKKTGREPKEQKETKEEKVHTPAPTPIVVPKADEMDIDAVHLIVSKPNFWTISGDNYLQIMQNYYSGNWYQGGESNYSILGRVTLQANYNNKQKVKFENKLEVNLGFQTNKSDTVHSVKTSSDLLRYTGKLGLQASKKWYYTLQIVGASQIAKSFASNSNTVKSSFLAPATLNASLGMDYTMKWLKGKLVGTIHLAPVAMNYKYVKRDELVASHGIAEGKHHITDYGSTFTLDANWKISDNVSWKTRLYGYTTYKRMELQWENTINMKISKYISTNIYIYPRYDDSRAKDKDFGHFQLKEYTSLGLAYQF